VGWFEEKISLRKLRDDEVIEDSFLEIAGAVMGKRLSDALNDERQKTKDAIDEILKYYHARSREVPDNIKDMNEVLEYLMRPYGIMRRNVELDPGWTKDAAGAMLGFRKDDNSVVALIPDSWLADDPMFSGPAAQRRAYVDYFVRRLLAPRAFVEEATRAHLAHV
jgi:hypothetical protein